MSFRAADHLEHVRGSGLLLQRLAQPIQQSGILNGDGSLTGKAGYQLDLLVTERPDLLAINGDRAKQILVLKYWHHNSRTRTPIFRRQTEIRSRRVIRAAG